MGDRAPPPGLVLAGSAGASAAAALFRLTTRGERRHDAIAWRGGDWLVFGSESRGLGAGRLADFEADQRVRLPLRTGQRSLNLSNAVAVAVFEAWRQQGWEGAV